MKDKNGFTLIELLAVIIILGILMIIAIPSVTRYISDSRKASYISTAKENITGARNKVNDGKLGMFDTDTTYYIPVSYIKTENANKSPYGEFTQAYVVVVYNGKGYNYYWTSVDDAGQGIKGIIAYDKLETDDVESDITTDMIDPRVTQRGVGERSKILILDPATETWREVVGGATTNVSEEGNGELIVIVPNPVSFSTDSWETIIKAAKNNNTSNYHVGDTKSIDLGSFGVHPVRIANMSTPNECKQEGYGGTACGFVIEFVDLIINKPFDPDHSNVGGYPEADLYTYIQTTLLDAFPKVVKDAMLTVKVISGGESGKSSNYITYDKLYLLSHVEVYGANYNMDTVTLNHTRQLDYYAMNNVTNTTNQIVRKDYTNIVYQYKNWWLRSASHYNKIDFNVANNNASGYAGAYQSNYSYGVSPGFRLA